MQVISVGILADLRELIQGVPLEGILSRFAAVLEEREEVTNLRAAEVMRELGGYVADQSAATRGLVLQDNCGRLRSPLGALWQVAHAAGSATEQGTW